MKKSPQLTTLCLTMLWSAFFATPALANHDDQPDDWELSASRLIYNEGEGTASFWLTSHSDLPWVVTGAVFTTNTIGEPLDRVSSLFLLNPPMAVIPPNGRKAFRLVWIGQPNVLGKDKEILERLRLRLIPSVEAPKSGESTMQISATVWVKIFARSTSLVTKDSLTNVSLSINCGQNTAVVHNPSPYWLTLRSLKSDNVELINPALPAPLLRPLGELSVSARQCRAPWKASVINDDGFSKEVPIQ